jgi:hypothetical protein
MHFYCVRCQSNDGQRMTCADQQRMFTMKINHMFMKRKINKQTNKHDESKGKAIVSEFDE